MVSSIVSYTYTDKTNQLKTIAVKNSLGENTLDITYGTPLGGGMPDVVKSESRNGSMSRAYFYDSLGRLYKERSLISSGSIEREFAYKNLSGNRTTSQVSQLTTNGVTYTYTYDNRGNIQTVSDGTYTTTYTYDNLDQLTREDNAELNKTFVYTYTNGNITSRKEYAYTTGTVGTAIKTDTWTYGNTSWGDVLTEYNDVSTEVSNGRITKLGGKEITYYYLGLVYDAGDTHYSYDTTGRRLKKTTGSTVTKYYYAGDMLVGEKTGSNKLEFMYDRNGDYYGFEYNDTPYFYVKNLQGDVIAIVNNAGTTVATYEYDAWGRLISSTDTSGNNIGTINPIRYRGYYYDKETGFYYLKTRYYSPEICRFLSPDGAIAEVGGDVLGYNQFSYCFNNPVNMDDNEGEWPKWATKLIVGTAVIAAAAVLTVATAGTGTALACFAVGALKGALVGAAVGAATGAVNHRVSTGSWKGSGQAALEGAADGYMSGAITGAVSGGLTSNVCFVAGTSILTSVGKVAIENIQADDYVWARNPETGEQSLKKVVQTFENETTELITISVANENIVCTKEHPFYSPAKGWIAACQLRAGDILVSVNGDFVVVEKVQHEILENPVKVYNFEVEDFHTYFVSDVSVLVHNVCHGNSLNTAKTTDLYVLRDKSTDVIKKIGETTRGINRYTKKFYNTNNVYMQIIDSGTKRSMHFQQHRLLKNFFSHTGHLPSLNKSFW